MAEHFRSSNPSMIIICYTLVKGLFTAAAVRSHLQIGVFLTAHAFAVLTALSAASYLSLLCVETVEKRRLLRRKVRCQFTICYVTLSRVLPRRCLLYPPRVFFQDRCVSGSFRCSGLGGRKLSPSMTVALFPMISAPSQQVESYTAHSIVHGMCS